MFTAIGRAAESYLQTELPRTGCGGAVSARETRFVSRQSMARERRRKGAGLKSGTTKGEENGLKTGHYKSNGVGLRASGGVQKAAAAKTRSQIRGQDLRTSVDNCGGSP